MLNATPLTKGWVVSRYKLRNAVPANYHLSSGNAKQGFLFVTQDEAVSF